MEVDEATARGVKSAIGQTGCIGAYHDGLTEGIDAVVEVAVPTCVSCADIHRHFVQHRPSRTRVRTSADGLGPHASIVDRLEQEIERAYRSAVIAVNMLEGSSVGTSDVGSSSAGRCPPCHSRPVAVIVMTG